MTIRKKNVGFIPKSLHTKRGGKHHSKKSIIHGLRFSSYFLAMQVLSLLNSTLHSTGKEEEGDIREGRQEEGSNAVQQDQHNNHTRWRSWTHGEGRGGALVQKDEDEGVKLTQFTGSRASQKEMREQGETVKYDHIC